MLYHDVLIASEDWLDVAKTIPRYWSKDAAFVIAQAVCSGMLIGS
jgi:hypothetical protein